MPTGFHNGRPLTPPHSFIPITERFWQKVKVADNGCWEWQGSKTNGYGHIIIGKKFVTSHNLSYEWLRGEVPEGMELDHLCRNRSCVNPWHLEPVTHQVNCARGMGGVKTGQMHLSQTHCCRGHEFTSANTWVDKKGFRHCKMCLRLHEKQYHHEGRYAEKIAAKKHRWYLRAKARGYYNMHTVKKGKE